MARLRMFSGTRPLLSKHEDPPLKARGPRGWIPGGTGCGSPGALGVGQNSSSVTSAKGWVFLPIPQTEAVL